MLWSFHRTAELANLRLVFDSRLAEGNFGARAMKKIVLGKKKNRSRMEISGSDNHH